MDDYLKGIAEDLRAGKRRNATVRTLLKKADAQRRGPAVIQLVRQKLKKHRLRTSPDFADAPFDDRVHFELLAPSSSSAGPKPDPAQLVHAADGVALRPLAIAPVTGWPASYRLLFRDFRTYVEGLKRIRFDGHATVAGRGQNKTPDDPPGFAYAVVLDRFRGLSSETEVHSYLAALTDQLASPPEPGTATPALDTEGMESRLVGRIGSGLADLRSTLEASMAALRDELRDKVEELRHDSIRRWAAAQNEKEVAALIDDEHARYASVIAKYEAKEQEDQEEIIRLAAQVEELEAMLTDALVPETLIEGFPSTAAMLATFIATAKGSPIEVLPSAEDSARRCSCQRRVETFQFLLVLLELAAALYRRGEIPGPLKDWFLGRGFEYAPKDSETTTSKFGDQRTFMVDGAKVRFEEHVTLFANTPDCVQIYFRRDAEGRRLQIGYLGPHLKIVSR